MPTPFAPRIILAQNARTDLQTLARAHSTPQSLALRARIVLRAAESISRPTCKSAVSWAVTTTRWASGDGVISTWAYRVCKMPCARGVREPIASPTRVQVISVASTLPQDQERTVTRWTLDEIVADLA